MYRDNELVDLDGKLAIHICTGASWQQPVMRSTYYVADKVKAERWPHILGCTVWMPNGWGYGSTLSSHGVRVEVDCHDWRQVNVETPIARPRNGKDYTWEWSNGKWQKAFFPPCSACGRWHDPNFPYCEECGHCHKPGSKCK